jgi:hypothetical protein
MGKCLDDLRAVQRIYKAEAEKARQIATLCPPAEAERQLTVADVSEIFAQHLALLEGQYIAEHGDGHP